MFLDSLSLGWIWVYKSFVSETDSWNIHCSLKEGNLNWEMLCFKSKFPREVLLCRVCCFVTVLVLPGCLCWLCLLLIGIWDWTHVFLYLKMFIFSFHFVNNAWVELIWIFQVGEFYEAIGIDACILVEYAGLNPFGGLRSDSIPKAGCPVVVFLFCFVAYCNNFLFFNNSRSLS